MSHSQQNHFARAMILQQQRRFADAAQELRQVLVAEPQNGTAHAVLALCLMVDERGYAEATAEAQQAVGLAPDLPLAHYALGCVLHKRQHLAEAKAAAHEAIQLDSADPDHFALLAGIEFDLRNWPAVLEHAEHALAIDPDHAWATNLRAMALVKLGRRAEAAHAMGEVLARDPENAYSHANQGWTLLHRGDHRQARVHFREALRLDPTLDWARAGMVEALKSGFPPYKYLLLFWLWMARLSGRAQWGVIIGAWVGYQVIRNIARNNPDAAKFLWPIMGAYIAFVIMTWLAYPLLNLMLRLHRDGRYALAREQVMQSNLIGVLLVICLAAIGLFIATRNDGYFTLMVVSGLLVMPAAGLFMAPNGWPRNVMLGVAIALTLIGGVSVALAFTFGQGGPLLGLFVLGIVASQLAANAMPMFRPKQ